MKKGMVQLQESILVTFFVIVIIIMGLIVFYRFSLSSVDAYEEEYREQQLLSLLITLPNEFGYTQLGDSRNAIDTSKLFNDDLNYGFKTIIIEQVYPVASNVVECKLQNYPNCNTFIVYDEENIRLENTLIESKPISLYFPLTDDYRAGKLIIKYYY